MRLKDNRFLVAVILSMLAQVMCTSAPKKSEPVNGFLDENTMILSSQGDSSTLPGKGKNSESGGVLAAAHKMQKPFVEICLARNLEKDELLCARISVICGERTFQKDFNIFRNSIAARTLEKKCSAADPVSGNVHCELRREYKLKDLKPQCTAFREKYSPCCDQVDLPNLP